MKEFKTLILGNASVAYYLAAETFALIALVISLWAGSKSRDIPSTSTPIQFSWKFLIWDNAKRIWIGQLVLFLFFRFCTEILGRELNMFIAVGIGFFLSFGLDKAIAYIKQKSDVLQMPREKFMEKQAEDQNKQ